MKSVGLRRQASTFDPCLFFVFLDGGQAVGAFAAHIGDILGCGEPDVLIRLRNCSEQRSGELKLQEESSARVHMECVHDSAFSATLTEEFTTAGHIAAIMGCA